MLYYHHYFLSLLHKFSSSYRHIFFLFNFYLSSKLIMSISRQTFMTFKLSYIFFWRILNVFIIIQIGHFRMYRQGSINTNYSFKNFTELTLKQNFVINFIQQIGCEKTDRLVIRLDTIFSKRFFNTRGQHSYNLSSKESLKVFYFTINFSNFTPLVENI